MIFKTSLLSFFLSIITSSNSLAQVGEFSYKAKPISPRALLEFMGASDTVDLKKYPYDEKTYKDIDWYTNNQKDSFCILELEMTDDGSLTPHDVEMSYKILSKTADGHFVILWHCIAGANLNYHLIMTVDLREDKLINKGTISYDLDRAIEIKGNKIINGSKSYPVPGTGK